MPPRKMDRCVVILVIAKYTHTVMWAVVFYITEWSLKRIRLGAVIENTGVMFGKMSLTVGKYKTVGSLS